MDSEIFLLNPTHGTKSVLDKHFYKHVESVLATLNEEVESRWEVYSIIIQQLINQGKAQYFKEIKYRLTDGENPNQVFLDIIEKEGDEVDGLVWSLKSRIEEYLDEDYIKRFCE